MKVKAIYENFCPNCGEDIKAERLSLGVFCKNCMPAPKDEKCAIPNLRNFKPFCDAQAKFENFKKFFTEKVGMPPNAVQEMWAKRFFLGNSFAMLAPTGIGKTTFGLVLSAFLEDAYIVLPTKVLVSEAAEKLSQWGADFAAYRGKKSEKEEVISKKSGIIVTTSQFLYKNRHLINRTFRLVFVDDVDSVLKSGKRINDILSLIGFKDADAELALKLAKEKNYEDLERLASMKKGDIIVSSATAKPRSRRVKLFFYLTHFEVSRPSFSLRNVSDLFEKPENVWEETARIAKIAGNNGFLFLPGNETKETLEKFVNFLKERGLNVASYEEFEDKKEDFKKGKILFAAFASSRNPLARGVDLPGYVKYAIFAGVPKISFKIKENDDRALYPILLILTPFLLRKGLLTGKEKTFLPDAVNFLRKHRFENQTEQNAEKIGKIREFLLKVIQKYSEEISSSPEIAFDGERIIAPDVTGYIQASGRTSRFYKGSLTKGISVLLVDDDKAFYALKKRLFWSGNIEFKEYSDEEFLSLLKEAGTKEGQKPLSVKTRFVVVESPTKAKTISSFFGKPAKRTVNGVPVYEIMTEEGIIVLAASIGHDFDLSDRGKFGVLEKRIPVFKVLENKDKILKALNIQSSEVGEVLIATDPDREGEKIAFDLTLANRPFNEKILRAEFHEISKKAFSEAVKNPHEVNENLVLAQFVRRIADRWIGFEVSQFLQKKLGRKVLSAGRVQTPVLKWVAERTLRLKEKVWAVKTELCGEQIEFVFSKKEDAEKFAEKKEITVKKTNESQKEIFITPFNTSEMLKQASEKLKFSPQKTMKIAQDLFENGFITYHRTDSIRVSEQGIKLAKDYVLSNFGKEYFSPRTFSSSKGAHECIRPAVPANGSEIREVALTRSITLDEDHVKLYGLIFDRFIASQMRSAVVAEAEFDIEGMKKKAITKILKDGFNLVWELPVSRISEGKFPAEFKLYAKPAVSPFTYAELVENMKEKGIGRPSTYAITIEKLLDRKYIVQKGSFLFATRLGFKVLALTKNSKYADYVSESYTASLEETIDRVANGEENYEKILENLYNSLFA